MAKEDIGLSLCFDDRLDAPPKVVIRKIHRKKHDIDVEKFSEAELFGSTRFSR